jgi:hypothetical protein
MTFPIPAPAVQQRILNSIDANIAMFRRYATPKGLSQMADLLADRANLVDFFAGKLDFNKMPWSSKEWLQEMPAWGTNGT